MRQQTRNNTRILSLKMLGEFSLAIDDQEIELDSLPGRKAITLLKLLALQPSYQILKEQAIELLWPNLPTSSASTQLYKAIHHLREAFNNDVGETYEFDWIALKKSIIRLSAPGGVTSDIRKFETSAREGMNKQDFNILERAAATYGGELLPSDVYTEWLNAPREHFRKMYIDVLFVLAKNHQKMVIS